MKSNRKMNIFSSCILVFIGYSVLEYCALADDQFTVTLENLANLQDSQLRDRLCFGKFNEYLSKLWDNDLNITDISDVGEIPIFRGEFKEPSRPKYDFQTQEWLMEDPKPILKLRTCFDGLYKAASHLMDNETRDCLSEFLKRFFDRQEQYTEVNEKLVNDEKPLPFREFLSFIDVEDVVFQNRSFRDNLTSHENNTYGHMKFFIPTDEDKDERVWILRQECDWDDLRQYQDAKDDQRVVLELFKNQTLRLVNQQLGNSIVENINLYRNITRKNLSDWLKARQAMIAEVESIVEKLMKSPKNDTQWLCEYASEIANKFASEQKDILLPSTIHSAYADLSAELFENKARSIEKHLENLNDTRRDYFKNLADRFEIEMRCSSSVQLMISNQQRYELAQLFIGKGFPYPQIYCRSMNLNLGLLAPMYCKCVGTYCVTHDIASLYAERFILKKNDVGDYTVSTFQINKPTQKVVSWPGIKVL